MNKFKKTIIIELNGLRADYFRRAIKEHRLTNIQKLFVKNGYTNDFIGYAGGNSQSVSAAVLTGKNPLELEIPPIPRFIRKKKWVEKKRVKFANKVKGIKPMLYLDYKKPVNIYSERPLENSNLGFFERKKRNWILNYARSKEHWEMLDRSATKTLIKLLSKDHDFYHLTYHAPGKVAKGKKDSAAHLEFGLDLLDFNVGLIYDALKEHGLLNDSLIIMYANHAQGQLNSTFDLTDFLKKNHFRAAENKESVKKQHQILTVQTGRSLAWIYFRPRSNNWADKSVHKDNINIKQKVANILVTRQEVDQVLFRIDADKVRITAKWGSSILSWNQGKLFYDVINGNDPFNLNNKKTSWSHEESFDITWKSRYPDVLWQVKNLFEQSDSGDMVINAKRGFAFAPEGNTIKRTVGSLNTDHLLIPVLSNRRGFSRIRRANGINRAILKLAGKEVRFSGKGKDQSSYGKRKKNKRYSGPRGGKGRSKSKNVSLK